MNLNTKLEKYMNITHPTSTLILAIWLTLTCSLAYSHGEWVVENRNQVAPDNSKNATFFSTKGRSESETFSNRIFDKNIRTMLVYTSKSELNPPIIQLNGSEQIILKFDDLSEDVRDLYYRFEHCTHD